MAQARKRPQVKRAAPGTKAHGGKRPGAGRWGSGFIQCRVCQHPERGRIDYLLAGGASLRPIGQQFGLPIENLSNHSKKHISPRYKQMVGASHLDSFEELLKGATEANAETIDTLTLLIRGHTQRWAICMKAGSDKLMSQHATRVMAAIELRSRVTLELQPEARNITVNNFMMKDAAELTNLLQNHPAAVAELEDWYDRRMKDVTPRLTERDVEATE
jgi:hypothetical protein